MTPSFRTEIRAVLRALRARGERLVLAESCTGGLVASRFTEIPGASELFCGSHVVYREGSKRAWLGVKASTLKRHSAVSAEAAVEMARGALRKTPEAAISGAITGYLGPSGKKIGHVYLSILRRGTKEAVTLKLEIGHVGGSPEKARLRRREIAAKKLLGTLRAVLER